VSAKFLPKFFRQRLDATQLDRHTPISLPLKSQYDETAACKAEKPCKMKNLRQKVKAKSLDVRR
jgi:hypothetical protein